MGYAIFNSQEHQKWLWQPCEHFVPKHAASICEALCKEQAAKGQKCDYGAIRLVADPRNVMVASAGEKGRMKVAIMSSDVLALQHQVWWQASYKELLWRFGSDGSIHMPNGLYLTATQEGYVGLHPPCATPTEPAFSPQTRKRFSDKNAFDAGDCCKASDWSLWEKVSAPPGAVG